MPGAAGLFGSLPFCGETKGGGGLVLDGGVRGVDEGVVGGALEVGGDEG